MHSSNFPKFFI